MGLISPTLPTSGQDRGSEEIDVLNSLTALVNVINGNLDTNNINGSAGITAAQLATAITQAAGLNSGATVRRGKSIITAEEQRISTNYGLHPTPDRVQNIVLPTDGLIFVTYVAQIKCSVANATSAGVFLGANQVKAANTTAAPAVVGISAGSGPQVQTVYNSMSTHPVFGLVVPGSGTGYGGDVTTGQSVATFSSAGDGGIWAGFAAAGTYDVSVQTKSTSGTVFLKNRNLWVWTVGF